MNLLLYRTAAEGTGERLQSVIETLAPKVKAEIACTLDRLSCRLRQPKDDFTIAVLLAASRNDLADILSIHDLLCDIRIILILPDREDDTVAWGHALQPRFLSYIDRDFTDVAAVLAKMVHQGIYY